MTDSLLLAGFALILASLALGVHALRRRRVAEAAARAAQALAAERGRSLGLLVQDLQAPALTLLGLAATAPPEAAAGIAAEARRLLTLSDDISDYLAAEAGPRRLSPAPSPLAPLVEEAVAAVMAQLGPARRQFRLAPDFAGLVLNVDRRALRGALLQVLTRAARLTREEDWIDLRPVLTADSLAIVVEDEGAGLGAEDLGTGPASPSGTRGLGFGLAVARALLEAHGGALKLEAMPGIGARAWLTLPRERLLAA